jgi:hypothetical protein
LIEKNLIAFLDDHAVVFLTKRFVEDDEFGVVADELVGNVLVDDNGGSPAGLEFEDGIRGVLKARDFRVL